MEDERRQKVLGDYRKRLLESREVEAKVKDCMLIPIFNN